MRRLGATAFLFLFAVSLTAQSQLLVKKTTDANVPNDGVRDFALPTACDQQGRIYVKLNAPSAGMAGPIYRLLANGALDATFDTSGELLNRFAVRSDGGVSMVRLDEKGIVTVDNFGPDGRLHSSLRLDTPPVHFFPDQIATFPSGELLLSGMQFRRGNTAYTTVYDSNGHVIKQFVLDGDEEIERHDVSRSIATQGDDGFVYLMRTAATPTVYVVSPAGEVVRHIKVDAPQGGTPEMEFRVMKNRIVASFRLSCQSAGTGTRCDGREYRVVDATTGQQLASYRADNAMVGPLGCYRSDPDRFQMLRMSTPGKLEIIEASAK